MEFGAYMMYGASCRLQLQTKTKEDAEYKTLLQMDNIQHFVNQAIVALAEDPPAALGSGSCIVHVPCGETVECPVAVGSELQVQLLENEDADAEDAVLGMLQVRVEKTAAGSESEYLPDAYKPLFTDPALRRPAYTESKRRLNAKPTEL